MRFKEGDRVHDTVWGQEGTVKVAYMDGDQEGVVVKFDDGGYGTVVVPVKDLTRPPKKFYIEGDMCPGAAGDVPVILAGPQSMIKNFSEGMEEYFEAEYDPTRGDNYHVTITVELIRGD